MKPDNDMTDAEFQQKYATASLAVLGEVAVERARQDAQWGGPAHDDTHDPGDWMEFVGQQLEKFACQMMLRGQSYYMTPDARQRFVKIAALSIAAVESMDRKRS
jgi:hypothetical protein